MKILHALGWYFPESLGGTEVYVAGLAERQMGAGHEVEVAAPLPGLREPKRVEHAGVPVLRYPIPLDPTRDEVQCRTRVRGAEHLHDYLSRSRPDILHVHTFTTGLGVLELEAARDLDIRIVTTNHLGSVGYLCQRGTLMRWGEYACDGLVAPVKCAACQLQHIGLPKLAAWTAAAASRVTGALMARSPGRVGTAAGMTRLIEHNRDLQRRALVAVDRFVLLNRAAHDVVVKNGGDPEKLALNYLGSSHRCSRPKPSPDELPTENPVRFGYLGRFVEIKGVLDLARAVSSLPKDLSFRLELRGPMDEEGKRVRARFEEIIRSDARVSFASPVKPADVPGVLARYDLLCVPSRWFENGPTVVSEAHAVGTPVLGTRIGAMPELIEDGVNGVLVHPGDWRALAAALAKIAAHPAGTIDAWRDALPTARTMDAIAEDYERLYEEVLDGF